MTEKICVCYTPCGPTYRKTTLEKLKNTYPEDPNICYSVITDDKEYFKGLQMENLIVKELKDFYGDYPHLEKYEAFLESTDVNDYAEKVVNTNYKFSFSSMRFHLLHAIEFGATNIGLMCTDSTLDLNRISEGLLSKKNMIYNAVSLWPVRPHEQENVDRIVKMLKEKLDLDTNGEIMVYDAAARFFVLESIEKVELFFKIWHTIITELYLTNEMGHYIGWVMYNDEHILAPIYNILGLKTPDDFTICNKILHVKHDTKTERFWAV